MRLMVTETQHFLKAKNQNRSATPASRINAASLTYVNKIHRLFRMLWLGA
jgi:hypothetical protein